MHQIIIVFIFWYGAAYLIHYYTHIYSQYNQCFPNVTKYNLITESYKQSVLFIIIYNRSNGIVVILVIDKIKKNSVSRGRNTSTVG